jgi:hypothetical protein
MGRRAALDVLHRGGNGVDAAVTAAFAVGVLEPWMSGIGGGGFTTIQRASGGRAVVDYFSRAPRAAEPAMYRLTDGFRADGVGFGGVKDQANAYAPLSIVTPGMVAGMSIALERFGTRTLAETLAPAIGFAEYRSPHRVASERADRTPAPGDQQRSGDIAHLSRGWTAARAVVRPDVTQTEAAGPCTDTAANRGGWRRHLWAEDGAHCAGATPGASSHPESRAGERRRPPDQHAQSFDSALSLAWAEVPVEPDLAHVLDQPCAPPLVCRPVHGTYSHLQDPERPRFCPRTAPSS